MVNLLGGIRFDWMAICFLFGPFFLLFISMRGKSTRLGLWLFQLASFLSISSNLIDFEYFKFTNKRTTADLFITSGLENDIFNLILPFIKDYWYLFILALLLWTLTFIIYRFINAEKGDQLSWKKWPLFALPAIAFLVLGFRGGIQYKPLGIIHAGNYATTANIPIVLNTPFTILKTLAEEELVAVNYFSDDSLKHLYSPIHHFEAKNSSKKLNVVLIILESFSFEFVGSMSGKKTQTPFLDSLIKQSLSFEYAFANGKKSIEALPSILAGLPTLMNTSYISSKYSANQLRGLGTILNGEGYQSFFYHGGENGTMGFNAFAKIAGIENYLGKNEYPYKGDDDGKWGIFDEPYLHYVKEELSKHEEPFFATLFTLSSHHPFSIPEKYAQRFNKNEEPLLNSINYADFALKKFFEEAQKEDWFDQTLFVITADHTSQSFSPVYNNRIGWYRIPLIFYNKEMIEAEISTKLSQQNDIFPSIVDFLDIEANVMAYGGSVLDTNYKSFNISYLNNSYQFIEGDYCIQFDGQKTTALYLWKEDPTLHKNRVTEFPGIEKRLSQRLKAILQQYQESIHKNQLVP